MLVTFLRDLGGKKSAATSFVPSKIDIFALFQATYFGFFEKLQKKDTNSLKIYLFCGSYLLQMFKI